MPRNQLATELDRGVISDSSLAVETIAEASLLPIFDAPCAGHLERQTAVARHVDPRRDFSSFFAVTKRPFRCVRHLCPGSESAGDAQSRAAMPRLAPPRRNMAPAPK